MEDITNASNGMVVAFGRIGWPLDCRIPIWRNSSSPSLGACPLSERGGVNAGLAECLALPLNLHVGNLSGLGAVSRGTKLLKLWS